MNSDKFSTLNVFCKSVHNISVWKLCVNKQITQGNMTFLNLIVKTFPLVSQTVLLLRLICIVQMYIILLKLVWPVVRLQIIKVRNLSSEVSFLWFVFCTSQYLGFLIVDVRMRNLSELNSVYKAFWVGTAYLIITLTCLVITLITYKKVVYNIGLCSASFS